MMNSGVKCNVCECMHNKEGTDCDLVCIQISHEKTTPNGVAVPHFCKSYEVK